MTAARLRLSCGSWMPVWKLKLPFQLVGKEETPNSGILLGEEGKGTFPDCILECPPPPGFLGQPGARLGTTAGGGRFIPRVTELVAEGQSWTWRKSSRRCRGELSQRMWVGSCGR